MNHANENCGESGRSGPDRGKLRALLNQTSLRENFRRFADFGKTQNRMLTRYHKGPILCPS
jgi:hypothetical protein